MLMMLHALVYTSVAQGVHVAACRWPACSRLARPPSATPSSQHASTVRSPGCARFVAEGDIVPRLPLLPAAAACAGGGPRPRSGYAHHAGLREVPRAADAAAAAVVAGPRRRKLPAPAVVCEVSVSAVGGGVAGAKRAGGARAGMGRGLPGRSERGVLARAAAAGAEVAGAAAAAAALAALGAAMPGVVANRPQEYVRALQAVAALA